MTCNDTSRSHGAATSHSVSRSRLSCDDSWSFSAKSVHHHELLWGVLDPKEMRREGSFAEGAIKLGIGRD
jgi:hypothetical protein